METYVFQAELLEHEDPASRKIEIRADATLEELHLVLKEAFYLNAERLYSFFMSGIAWDQSTEYTRPDGDDQWMNNLLDAPGVDAGIDEDKPDVSHLLPIGQYDTESATKKFYAEHGITDDDEDDPVTEEELRELVAALKANPDARRVFKKMWNENIGLPEHIANRLAENLTWLIENSSFDETDETFVMQAESLLDNEVAGDVRTTHLNELGLIEEDTFLYLFDYAYEWKFDVTLQAINLDADPNLQYPRVLEEVGELPYSYIVEGEEYEEEEEDAE